MGKLVASTCVDGVPERPLVFTARHTIYAASFSAHVDEPPGDTLFDHAQFVYGVSAVSVGMAPVASWRVFVLLCGRFVLSHLRIAQM